MNILVFDTETTGLDTANDRIIELGAVLFSTQTNSIWHGISFFVWEEGYPTISEEITGITGITQEMVSGSHISPKMALTNLAIAARDAELIVAHNAAFDMGMLTSEIERQWDYLSEEEKQMVTHLKGLPTVCTIGDVEYAKKFKCKKLSHLALDHGLPVDPSKLHRAVDDVELLVRLIIAAKIDFKTILEKSKYPYVYLSAQVKEPWKDKGTPKQTDLAKQEGFTWEKVGDKVFPKLWVKRIRECDLQDTVANLPFPALVIREV